jgi:hypothetical protein
MNRITAINILFFLLIVNSGWLLGQTPVSEKDTTRQRNIKINPIKFFFNEISVSHEQFKKITGIRPSASDLTGIDSIIYKRKTEQISSVNYILGIVFPSNTDHAVAYKQDIHNACIKELGDAGLSPFINWGLSTKFEFRRYRNTFYYGPQFMEKFVFYPKTTVDNLSGTEMDGLVRLQSGYANVLGFGYFIGWQTEKKGFVTDLFLGAGCRLRLAVRKIYEEQNYLGPNVIFPEPKTENLNRLYPFLNLGVRLGFNI